MAVSEQIIQVINTLCEKVGIAINWTDENVIPYLEVLCKKLVTYKVVTSATWILVTWVLFGVSAITTKKLHPWLTKKGEENLDDGYITLDMILWSVTVALGIVMICVTCGQAPDIIKCLTFPEMYVLEYVSRLVK